MNKIIKILIISSLIVFILSWFFFMIVIIVNICDIKSSITVLQTSSIPVSIMDTLKKIDSNTPYYIFITIFATLATVLITFTFYVNNKSEKLYDAYREGLNGISNNKEKLDDIDKKIESNAKFIEDINYALLLYIKVEKIKSRLKSNEDLNDKIFDIQSHLLDVEKYAENLYSIPDVIYYEYASLKKPLSLLKNDVGILSRINKITKDMEKRRSNFVRKK